MRVKSLYTLLVVPARMVGREVRTIVSPTTGIEIPVIAAKGMVFSCWTPSKEELVKINSGLPVWLIQRGPSIPEMTMLVGDRSEVIPRDFMLEAINETPRKEDEMVQNLEKQRLERVRWQEQNRLFAKVFLALCATLGLIISGKILVYLLHFHP